MVTRPASSINPENHRSDMKQIDFSSMDLNLLKVFEALYEERGASRAAIRLGVTQSTVSAALARLRRMYADHLFERTGRGLQPTARAHALRPLVATALEHCRQSLALAMPRNEYGARTLTLGLSDDYEIALGGALIALISSRMPGLRLILRQTHSLVAGDMLMAREIDLSLTASGVTARTLGRQLVGMGGYACVADPSQLPDASLDIHAYLRREHVLVSSGGFVGIVDEALSARGLGRKVRASTTHFAALPHLLLDSDRIATLPAHAANALARTSRLQCLPCPLPLPRYPVELGWRTEGLRDPAIQALKTLLADLCRQHHPDIATEPRQADDGSDASPIRQHNEAPAPKRR